jgi:hypothetical protein
MVRKVVRALTSKAKRNGCDMLTLYLQCAREADEKEHACNENRNVVDGRRERRSQRERESDDEVEDLKPVVFKL